MVVMARFTRKSVKILTTTKFNQSQQSKKGGNQKNHVISTIKGSAPEHSSAIKFLTPYPTISRMDVFPKILGGIIIMLAKIFGKRPFRKSGLREIVL
jgi:hypothetical protein